ncbi:hypothetical protein RRF57_004590 [Xylaria bambusicola]|uniref:C2 domain-containing protein n=1 Tax=Xylaria bambusicola TaxID=326684 RepID=A0AAN7UAI1_9PEZI
MRIEASGTMATRSKVNMNAMHTAGIFSDMSIDGPEIGTLVLIVDRAKNLPNRKTIGKQDPYCAARLGKEAKKTATDIRGDYFQLKLSVFNDDKKTELIGETWIDLRDIVVQGGGQSDQWHNLNCKGKYAGSIRIETTYYDSRPKPEKPAAKLKPVASSSEPDLAGSAQRSAVKRRPLPSDPVTGLAPSQPSEPIHTPPRVQPNPPSGLVTAHPTSHIVEYSTPPQNRQPPPENYPQSQSPGYQHPAPPSQRDYQPQRGAEKTESFHTLQHESDPFYQPSSAHTWPHEVDSKLVYSNPHPGYASQPQNGQSRRSVDGERPPPPPAHRARHSSGHSSDANPMHRTSYELVPHKSTPPMRHDVLRQEAHRYSVLSASSPSAYPGRPTYKPSESAPNLQNGPPSDDFTSNAASAPRHHSFDSGYDAQRRPMQPTVEDVPESWTPPQLRSRSSISPYDEPDVPYEQQNPGQLQSQAQYDDYENNTSPSPALAVDYSQALTHVPRSQTYQIDHYPMDHHQIDHQKMNHYHMQLNGMGSQVAGAIEYSPSAVPPTLVPGVDPNYTSEVSERHHQDRKQERRYTQPTQMVVVHSRGRQHSEPPSHYAANYAPHGHPTTSRSYERAPVAYSSGPNTPSAVNESPDPRRVSPSPTGHHVIKRKSVSPAPPPSEPRRLSGVPFGPDSYDTFNPSVSASREDLNAGNYTNADGKIVTSDGREVDPSDHLPMDTWAPEPEPKNTAPPTETRIRPALNGAQPMPSSGRRPLRVAARPQSMALTPPVHATQEPTGPRSAGRNRLQKKNHRASALPAPLSTNSNPLSPTTAHQRNSTPPRAIVRASTFDYENHGPPFNNEFGIARTGYGSGPPIPAKVPMMSGGLGPSTSMPPGSEELSLMEEMSRIDIGTGRARRHHGGY